MTTYLALAALLLASTAHAQDFFDFEAAQRLRQTQAGGAEEAGDSFGASLATGDFDADGYDDLVIGAPGENASAISNAGVVFVFLGSPSGLVDFLRLVEERAHRDRRHSLAERAAGDGEEKGAVHAAGVGHEAPAVGAHEALEPLQPGIRHALPSLLRRRDRRRRPIGGGGMIAPQI